MRDSISWILRGLVAAALLQQGIASSAAQRQAIWPQRPVRLIVPAAAGGSADVLARQLALQMEADLKQTFIVENRPGGANLIGAHAVVSAAPDGYTLLAHGVGSHVIATPENPNALDPRTDFTHIAYIGGVPAVLAVNVAVPVKDVASLVAYSRTFPDGLNWGSPGPGTRSYIIGELFRDATKARITHIPYKGAGQAVTDLLGNHIPIAFLTISSARALIDEGRIRALAVSSRSRLAHYPGVPTFAELGFPRLTGSSWFGISGPPGMPAALANKINADVNRAVASAAVRKFLAAADFEPIPMSASEFTQFFLDEINLLEPFVRAISQPVPAQ